MGHWFFPGTTSREFMGEENFGQSGDAITPDIGNILNDSIHYTLHVHRISNFCALTSHG